MTDSRLGGTQLDKAEDTAALRRFLLDLDTGRKGGLPGQSLTKDTNNGSGKDTTSRFLRDGFLNFNDPFNSPDIAGQQEQQKLAGQARQINDLVSQRNLAENALNPEQKDSLRLARRDYSLAKTPSEQKASADKIEALVPGSADLNQKIKVGLLAMRANSIDFTRMESFSPRYTSTIQCHTSRPEPSYADQQAALRRRNESNMYSIKEGVRDAADRFYKPLPEDKFEARWAQMALESPLVKATEAMKQLPPIKISVENAADVIKFGSTVSGVEIDSNSKKMLEDLTRGVKSISKEGRDSFVIERAGKADIPLPAKVSLPGGMAATGIEIDSLRFRIGDGKYPELNGIEGLKVKLEVPTIGRIGQIDNECQIKRLYVTRVPGSSDLELKVVVTNPVPALLRHTIGFVKSDMPTGATIDTKIATLGADGKLK